MLVLEHNRTTRFFAGVGADMPAPQAVVCMSAHWQTDTMRVSVSGAPATIHDFGPFDPRLFQIVYPAPGAPQLGERIVTRLHHNDIEATADPARGFDHGVWTLLKRVYPDADVPVVAVSVMPAAGPRAHFSVGRALAELRDEGVLLIGSGGSTHNLNAADLYRAELAPAPQALAFETWLQERVQSGDTDALFDYVEQAPFAAWNHPTPEHLLPLYFALGAASDPCGELLHAEMRYGSVGHSAFRWS